LLSLPARLISSLLLRAPPTSLALLPLNTDATILIPMLSSLSKNKVFPMVPRVVGLPLDKFQQALAHTLQGSAHTSLELTPTEVWCPSMTLCQRRTKFHLKR
ncbi:hypothetical protein SOVF_023580 isoform B, partial [Spinacia oleracea]